MAPFLGLWRLDCVVQKCIQHRKWRIFAFPFAKSMEIFLQIHHHRSDSSFSSQSPLLYKRRLLTYRVNLLKLLQVKITTRRTVTSPLQLTDSNSYYTKDHRTTKKAFTTDMSQLYWPNYCCEVFWKSFLDPSDLLSLVFFFIKWVKVCLPCQQRPFNSKIEGLLQVG